jgi:predicted amidohydrolase YtcJ
VIPGLIDVHAHLDREGLKNLHPGLEGLLKEVYEHGLRTHPLR